MIEDKHALLLRAEALLLDAGHMLHMAEHWRRNRAASVSEHGWNAAGWKARSLRIAERNDKAAQAMLDHASKIAKFLNSVKR